MANAQKNDVIYVDTTGDITVESQRPVLLGMNVEPNGTSPVTIIIKETSSSGTIKFKLIRAETLETFFVDLGMLCRGHGIVLTPTFNINITNVTSVTLYGQWNLKV
ncbi:hypothetical protein [Caudoviricetes sp.]|nr:hypothetical protein [Caudoviricetes sp.]UOF79151.1 hypothetical protein [Caudoviricetes sp.]